MNTVSYSKIIPDEVQIRLIAIRDQETANAWEVGDICWMLKEQVDAAEQMIGMMEIYSAVACYVGKASRTVREYAMLSKSFDPEIREVYAVLSHDHFRKAHSVGARWKMALEWCIDIMEKTGRPATVDALEAYIATNLQEAFEEPPDDGGSYEPVLDSTFFEGIIHNARGILKALAMRAAHLLSEDDLQRVTNAVAEIEEVLQGYLTKAR